MEMLNLINKYNVPSQNVFDNFEKYIRRQNMSRFIARYELFKMQMDIKGNIVECGVHHGGGLFAWAKLSSALEPYALDRHIYGFDTFEGFPGVANQDLPDDKDNKQLKVGGFSVEHDIYEELAELKNLYNDNRFLNQFEKLFLVKGDALLTIPKFIEENKHFLISLLYLDFDLYEPTKVALEYFMPRMSKGAILAFDEINNPWWPGETQAMLETLDLKNYKIQRFSFDPNVSYIVL